jgi:hypothetical protein
MERLLVAGGLVVGLLGGFVTALWEIFLSPLAARGILLPVSPVLAVVTNVALVWFTRRVTRRNGLALLPGLVWFLTMFAGSVRTAEGDLPIPGNDWPGLVALLAGAAAYGVTAYLLILPNPRT